MQIYDIVHKQPWSKWKSNMQVCSIAILYIIICMMHTAVRSNPTPLSVGYAGHSISKNVRRKASSTFLQQSHCTRCLLHGDAILQVGPIKLYKIYGSQL